MAKHLKWPAAKVQTAINYAKRFQKRLRGALSENAASDFEASKRRSLQETEFVSREATKG